MAVDFEVIKTPTGALKLCELVLTILILSIGQGAVGNYGSQGRNFFIGGVVVLSIVATPLILLTYLMGNNQIQKTAFEFLLNTIVAIMMLTAGSLIINTYTAWDFFKFLGARDAALTAGSFGIINSVIYGLDAFFAYQNYTS